MLENARPQSGCKWGVGYMHSGSRYHTYDLQKRHVLKGAFVRRATQLSVPHDNVPVEPSMTVFKST